MPSEPSNPGFTETVNAGSERPSSTRYYRRAFGLFGGYFALAVIVAIILPIFVACAILALISLAKHEPYRIGMVAILLISCGLGWTLLTGIVRGVWQQLT